MQSGSSFAGTLVPRAIQQVAGGDAYRGYDPTAAEIVCDPTGENGGTVVNAAELIAAYRASQHSQNQVLKRAAAPAAQAASSPAVMNLASFGSAQQVQPPVRSIAVPVEQNTVQNGYTPLMQVPTQPSEQQELLSVTIAIEGLGETTTYMREVLVDEDAKLLVMVSDNSPMSPRYTPPQANRLQSRMMVAVDDVDRIFQVIPRDITFSYGSSTFHLFTILTVFSVQAGR